MNWLDRCFCQLLGHTWWPVFGRDAARCVHCELEMSSIEVISYRRRQSREGSAMWALDALSRGWPKRISRRAAHRWRV